MNEALAKIVDQIKLKTDQELLNLKKENSEKIDQEKLKYEKLIRIEKLKLQHRMSSFKNVKVVEFENKNKQLKNFLILQKKQNLIEKIVKQALYVLQNETTYEKFYFSFMENLIEKNLSENFCELFYGKFDFNRFIKNLKFKPSSKLKINKSDNFDLGAKIVCDDFYVNLNVEFLIFNWLETFKFELLKVLQLEGV